MRGAKRGEGGGEGEGVKERRGEEGKGDLSTKCD